MGDDKLFFDDKLDKWFFVDEHDFIIGPYDDRDDAVMARDTYYHELDQDSA